MSVHISVQVMSKLAAEHKSVNLGQGFPDDEGPESMKQVGLHISGVGGCQDRAAHSVCQSADSCVTSRCASRPSCVVAPANQVATLAGQ